MIYPDLATYQADSSRYSVIPVFQEVSADFETPLSIFLKTKATFLLESIERGENVGRYSIITIGRNHTITMRGRELTVHADHDATVTDTLQTMTNPLEGVRAFFQRLTAPAYEGLPPFFGGAIGYLGYETVQYFEDVPIKAASGNIPDGLLIIPAMTLVYDSVKRTVCIIAAAMTGAQAERNYAQACANIAIIQAQLNEPLTFTNQPAGQRSIALTPDITKEQYLAAVATCQEYIQAGDIYQVVPSQRFHLQTSASPFEIYQALRILNPSPYLFYLDFGDFCLIGSSPEVMVKVHERELLLKPIAGTRPRGRTITEDSQLARDLMADPKERAEHIMLVDLGRNDLGRVAVPGSVTVSDYMSVEKYSHVMHIVSTVQAQLAEPYDVFDVIRATFPAGTLSGAPKIRAMEIIAELEPVRRGPYGGMVFYLGYNGTLDSCITIRTIVYQNGQVTIQAGGGVVADSVPELEYQETLNKAGALVQAIEMAEGRR